MFCQLFKKNLSCALCKTAYCRFDRLWIQVGAVFMFALAVAQQARGLTYYCSSECLKVAITPPKENEKDKELFDALRRQMYRRCLDMCAATAFPHE